MTTFPEVLSKLQKLDKDVEGINDGEGKPNEDENDEAGFPDGAADKLRELLEVSSKNVSRFKLPEEKTVI